MLQYSPCQRLSSEKITKRSVKVLKESTSHLQEVWSILSPHSEIKKCTRVEYKNPPLYKVSVVEPKIFLSAPAQIVFKIP